MKLSIHSTVLTAIFFLISISFLIALPQHSGAQTILSPVVDTGQTACYNDAGTEITCPSTGQAFYGQDAQHTGNVPSFTNNNDGTITDNITALMWQQSPDTDGDGDIDADDKLTYAASESYCQNLSLASHTDWRLPDIKQLYSLIDFRGTDPSGYQGTDPSDLIPFIDTTYFDFAYGDTNAGERLIDAQYASSTLYVSTVVEEALFGVNFADGRIKGYGLTIFGQDKTFFVICVRENSNYGVNDFIDNGDSTITDNASELMWAQDDNGTGLNLEEALAWVEEQNAQNYLGYNDWRLPNAKELQSIIDYSRSPDTSNSAAINPLFNVTSITNEANQTDYPYYWSSTTHANWTNTPGAWGAYVSFGRAMGYMNNNWVDVHGAGSQRSDPKSGDPADYPTGHGPQGDAVRIYNYVRLVRDADSGPVATSTSTTTSTSTPMPPNTATSIATNTPTVIPSATSTATSTAATSTNTPIATISATSSATATPLATATPSATTSATPAATVTVSNPVVDTGQIVCYNDSVEITCPSAGQSFYGQDAQHIGNVPSFTNNGNGTITDNITALMWQQSPDSDGDGDIDVDDKFTYAESESYCQNLSLANYTDWRLPDIKQLYSLIDFSGLDPSGYEGDTSSLVPFIDTTYFEFAYGDTNAGERIIDAQYASSTLYVSTATEDMLFGVNFADGRIKGYGLTVAGQDKTFFVICVRENSNYGVNNFVDNGDSTITDNASGLMWSKDDNGSSLNWQEALTWVEEQNTQTYLGYSDWRLPNAKELQSLIDYSRSPDTSNSAAIDPLFNVTSITNEANQTDYPYYWSSTTHANWTNTPGANGVYLAFGRAMGYINNSWVDVHGAGAQRSDPKSGDPTDYPTGHGPQGDAIHIYNYVRLVRNAETGTTVTPQDHKVHLSLVLKNNGESTPSFTINQTLSDGAQRNTIAFDALAFTTGSLEADSFFPPGKVADFWGFQYLRDNDPSDMGHNTDFLTRAALNMLTILTPAQRATLITLAQNQVDDINQYGYNRFVLMQAFRRLLENNLPSGSTGLDETAVKAYSAELYQLDGEISYERAQVMGTMLSELDDTQQTYLDAMVGEGMLTWPDVEEVDELQGLDHDVKVAVMTYAGDMFSWYAGDIEADVYFCPERQGTYFGSFYMKGALAVGNPGYTIPSNLTADMGEAFLDVLTADQSLIITDLVDNQKVALYQIVDRREDIASLLREFMAGNTPNQADVLNLMTQYGQLDGEIVYSYATAFAQVYQLLTAEQKAELLTLRTDLLDDLSLPDTAYLYSDSIVIPDIPNTDFLFLIP